MTYRSLLLLACGLTLGGGISSAASFTYVVTLNTPDFGVPGWIDLSFNQANTDAVSATATIDNVQQTGFTFGTTQTSSGVSGSLSALPVVIPNGVDFANYFTQEVIGWGSLFQSTITLSGPALGSSAPDGSAFRVTLFDENFNPLVTPLPFGDVANIEIGTDGSLTPQGSTFADGSASVDPAAASEVPEPATLLLAAGALGALLLRRAV
jgi:hypothetical protein